MSTVYRSPLGQGYALYLEALADDYVARMLALGLTPQHIASAVGGGKPPDKCKPPRKRRARRVALQTVSDLEACIYGEGAQGPEDDAHAGHEGQAQGQDDASKGREGGA